jgi:hypothetical protein
MYRFQQIVTGSIKRITIEIPCGGLHSNLSKRLIKTLPMCLEKFARTEDKGTNSTTLCGIFAAISGYLNVLHVCKRHGVQTSRTSTMFFTSK